MTPAPALDDHALERAAALIRRGEVVVLTGAGVSVDSGIPDFRSPGGLWERYPIEEYATIEAFLADPLKSWRLFGELAATLAAARPNPGHEAIARLEAIGLVSTVITQNIDGLHQAAGSRDVVEFHGSAARLRCVRCPASKASHAGPTRTSATDPPPPRTAAPAPPTCHCGQILKPDVVLFGEMIPPDALARARQATATARACLVCGTSAQVFPAAAIPEVAAARGAGIVEVNLEPTPLTQRLRTVLLSGPASRVLPALVARVEAG
jgi:NAD-dependent deacetylase